MAVTFNYPFNQISEPQKKTLQKLCYEVKAKKILEVGSWVGESTSALAEHAMQNDGFVVSVDWWKGNPGTEIFNVAQTKDVFTIYRNNLTELDLMDVVVPVMSTSANAAEFIADNHFDLIFIDADHRYSYVKEDIKLWLPKVRPGGILCGHDCEGNTYNESYIEQDYVGNKHHGVCKAVHEVFPACEIQHDIWIHRKSQ